MSDPARIIRCFCRAMVLAVLLPSPAASQQIRGVVVEDSTSRPITSGKIELIGTDGMVLATSLSASTGWFHFTAPAAGQFKLRASHEAYRRVDSVAVELGARDVITVVLRLNEGPIPIEPVIANAVIQDRASGYRERARRNAFGRFITREDIDRHGGISVSHLLRFTPEVRLERVWDGAFASDGVFMRSFGDLCVPAIYLDGVPVIRDRGFDINDLLSVESVEGIEVYRNIMSAPMELRLPSFGEDMFCGVIALWSRQVPRAPLTWKSVSVAGLLVGASLLLTRIVR